MKKGFIIGSIVVVAIILLGVIVFSQPTNTTNTNNETAVLDPAPDFALEDINGNTVSLDDFAGQPLVINAWAVWCPFCRNELPDFVEAQKQFGDDVTIIAIDRAETLGQVTEYLEEIDIQDELVFLMDPTDSFYKSIGGFSMPETIFVDRDGNIQFHKRGPMPLEEINERIETLLTQ